MRINCFLFVPFIILFSACGNPQEKPGKIASDTIISDSTRNHQPEKTEKYVPVSPELYAEIVHMDSVMFNAFNAHNMEELKKTFSEDLEFYHDKGGLADYKKSMENFKSLFEANQNTGLRRDLVPGSIEVYPINEYGAVETGMHTFCHKENGRDDCGTFKFTHIWQKKNGQWKVTRVISYDH